MRSYNKIIFGLVAALILCFLLLFFSVKSLSQDSVSLKIVRIKTTPDGKKVIWFKEGKNRFASVCDCSGEYKKGDTVTIPKSKRIIIKDSFKKTDF